MDQSEGSDLSLTDKKEGRRPKRHAKGKTSSFPDEAPTFIEERISGPPAVQVVRYTFGEVLGKGAAATVYKGKNAATGELVAIKKIFKGGMRSEQLKQFLKAVETEYTLMKQLNHPNVVAMKGRVEDATNVYIILEYVNGGSLATYLSKYGTFSPDIAAVQMRQVLQGLEYLHQKGIAHRDIKAANLLITKSGIVKLADFGVSAQLDHTAEKRYSVVGTPYWMAPEVIAMTGHTGRSDIWSLGCTLLELITGHPPYWELDQMRAVFCIAQDERPPIPPEITGDLYRFLHQCFIKDPEKRASAHELLSHPYILNAKMPVTTPSGKLDTKVLKRTLRNFHGSSADDDMSDSESSAASTSTTATMATNTTSSSNSSAPSSAWVSRSPVSKPTDHALVPLEVSSVAQTSQATAAPASPRNVARVANPRYSEPDPHEPVPSVHNYNESSHLIQSKEKYVMESSNSDAPPCVCNIL